MVKDLELDPTIMKMFIIYYYLKDFILMIRGFEKAKNMIIIMEKCLRENI